MVVNIMWVSGLDTRFDVTSVGSTMIRLSVASGERLETAAEFVVRTAGTESNTMVALSRMGKRTAWASRLCENSLGKRITNDIGHFGVDTSSVIWTDIGRNEVFFVEYGASPRPIQVIYDREHSAVSVIDFNELDLDYLLDTRVLHLTGIFPALSDNCADVTNKLIDAAHTTGVKVSFDVNYRSKLWSAEKACSVLSPMMNKADILFITLEDAKSVFGFTGSPAEIVMSIYTKYSPEIAVLTLGGDGGVAFDGKELYNKGGYTVEVRDRLGAGDCFAAGVLCGYLEGSIKTGMEYATAMAALKMGINGDYFVSDKYEVMALINSTGGREVGR